MQDNGKCFGALGPTRLTDRPCCHWPPILAVYRLIQSLRITIRMVFSQQVRPIHSYCFLLPFYRRIDCQCSPCILAICQSTLSLSAATHINLTARRLSHKSGIIRSWQCSNLKPIRPGPLLLRGLVDDRISRFLSNIAVGAILLLMGM